MPGTPGTRVLWIGIAVLLVVLMAYVMKMSPDSFMMPTMPDTSDGTPYQGRYSYPGDPTVTNSIIQLPGGVAAVSPYANAVGGPYYGLVAAGCASLSDIVTTDDVDIGCTGGCESLTSQLPCGANSLTSARTGLGTIHRDPRFLPGPQCPTPEGDTAYAPGTHAGWPTLGGYSDYAFMPGNTWDSRYIHAR